MLYEFINEEGIVHSYKLRSRPKPIIKKREFRAGDRAPEFVLNPGDVRWADKPAGTGRWIHTYELTQRPLVIAFFCAAWGTYGDRILPQLRKIHQQATEAGARFLVLTQTPTNELEAMADRLDLDFDLGYDKNNRIARLLGAYDPNYPIWDRVAGINEDVFSPGLFVLNPQGKFAFAQLDKDFEMHWEDIALSELLSSTKPVPHVRYA